ncbi:hypothetical protein [Anaerotignum sp.]|uniref:hypothetical protein n=1 Tax=Anaerotignum sp. TaxID=2039241 RepID=UPI0028A83198|nr:hypothetical protein [Anaerotignum sp.]
MENVVKDLKREGLLRTYYKDKLRGYRPTSKAKALLLATYPNRFAFFLTGNSETNRPKSEITRRRRLHRMAECLVTMQQAGVLIFRDEKPEVFYPEVNSHPVNLRIDTPAFYNSREIKEIGTELVKIRGARMVGVLLTRGNAFVIYNTGSAKCRWEYKSEMRTKALMKTILCQQRLAGQYAPNAVQGILMGEDMKMAYELLTTQEIGQRNYFVLDGNYDSFHYIPNNHDGEVMLKILCDGIRSAELRSILSENLSPHKDGSHIENDGFDHYGRPVLFAHTLDLPRIARFYQALQLQERSGTIICFDFQADMLKRYCKARTSFEIINLQKYEGRFHN